jgi:BirA family transcriptional regulator, biotin operon repressor / biotin---[acetyl-CoA-carboxylase] ligase
VDAVELQRWHGEAPSTWRDRWGVPDLQVFRTIGSTNDRAAELAGNGAAQGTLVLADAQTRGRGRRGRSWSAPSGASLSMSMVLRPPSPESTRLLTLRLGIAAAEALEELARLPVGIKWPNDLELGGRKVAGILCEATALRDRIAFVVAGIGLNLRPPDDGWPPDLAARATSIAEAIAAADAVPGDLPDSGSPPPGTAPGAAPVATPVLVERLVGHWLGVAARPAATLSPDELAAFDARDALRGQAIAVDGRAAGVARGITPTGALRVQTGDAMAEITTGTVRVLDPTPGGRT